MFYINTEVLFLIQGKVISNTRSYTKKKKTVLFTKTSYIKHIGIIIHPTIASLVNAYISVKMYYMVGTFIFLLWNYLL